MLDSKAIPLAIRHLVKFIRAHAATANCSALLVDLDGTLNSVVTLALCRQSQIKTIAVEFNSDKMEHLAKQLGVLYIRQTAVTANDLDASSPIVKMPYLDVVAKENEALLVGSFNRNDHRLVRAYHKRAAAFDILPIADLHMSEVRQLGKFLAIPESLLSAPQASDSDFSYSVLERADQVIGEMASQPHESINVESYLDSSSHNEQRKRKSRHKENRGTPICAMGEHRIA